MNRATPVNWIICCAANDFTPLYDYFHRELVKRQFLMADETRIQALKGQGRSAEMECYQGYNNLPDVTRCCCWAHLRRYFLEAIPRGKELDYRSRTAQGMHYCNRLFEYERLSTEKGHSHERWKEYRLPKEKPVLDAFWEWISGQYPKKGTRFGKVVNYALNHREAFMAYLEDDRCSFPNNLSENAIRSFTVGRKNWLFSDTPAGAEASAIVYTMVEMGRVHKLNIYINPEVSARKASRNKSEG